MNTSSPVTSIRGANLRNQSSIMEKSLILNEKRRKSKKSFLWGSVNLCLLGVLLYDIAHTCPIHITSVLYLEYFFAGLLFINTMYHFLCCFGGSLNTESIEITSEQKRLLGVKDYDPNYTIVSEDATPKSPIAESTSNASFSTSPINMTTHSWKSSLSTSNNSFNYSIPSSSFSFMSGSPKISPMHEQKQAENLSPLHHSRLDSSFGEFINDEQSLGQYLKGYALYEKAVMSNSVSPVQQHSSVLSSFWSHPAASLNHTPFIKKNNYQLSSLPSGSSSSSPSGADDKESPINQQQPGNEIWHRLRVNSYTLTQWNANIRMWLSQTIIERLVHEIDNIDDALQRHGLSDIKVGAVGLDRLRKTAQMAPVLQFIPTLSTLIPFLEVCSNQEYIVKRIRELAKGGCMSEFKWNGGSSFNGKEWNNSLPTDSALVMHLFVTYMDTQLLPLPNQPDVKPFSGYHYIKCTDKMPELTSNTIAIRQYSEKPPHHHVIVGEEIFEMIKGYNNLFHTLLLFLYQVNKREHGMLGRINLGCAGVNILWVIDS